MFNLAWNYYEGNTSGKTVLKDLALSLSTAVKYEPITDPATGAVLRQPQVFIEKNWDVVFPKVDSTRIIAMDWNNLTPDEFEAKVKDQTSRITNTVIMKTTTTPKDVSAFRGNELGIDEDLSQSSLSIYVEMYKPAYLIDPEQYSLDCERQGVMPYIVTKDEYIDHMNPIGENIINLRKMLQTDSNVTVTYAMGTKNSGNIYLNDDDFNNLVNSLRATLSNSSIDVGTTINFTSDIIKELQDTVAEDIICTKAGISITYFRESANDVFELGSDGVGKYFNIKVYKKYADYQLKAGLTYVLPEGTNVDANSLVFRLGDDIQTKDVVWSYTAATSTFKILKTVGGNSDIVGEPFLAYTYKKNISNTYGKNLIPNNHYILVRSFDKLNAEGTGPADDENIYDANGKLLQIVCHTSPWYKLSWYQDFETLMIDDIDGDTSTGIVSKGSVILPIVTDGLTEETKIKFMLNTNNDRAIVGFLGNPSLDFNKNRHLLSAAYMGSIESFDNSINDTAGNFGIFTCSSTIPCFSKTIFNKTQYTDSTELGVVLNSNTKFSLSLGLSETFDKDYDINVTYTDVDSNVKTINKTAGLIVNFSTDYNTVNIELPSSLPDSTVLTLNYAYYDITPSTVKGVTKDYFGNLIAVQYPDTWGKYTGTGTLDFSMFHTRSKVYWQKHFFMFTSTEEYMSKEMYGKSAYTDEFYADRIKVTHPVDGPRGMLYDMLVIDTSSLNTFDELIINRNFSKDTTKTEDTYVYFPVTTAYSPFANSPNGLYGLAIKKQMNLPAPLDDEMAVDIALDKIDLQTGPITNITGDFILPDTSLNDVAITWNTTTSNITMSQA